MSFNPPSPERVSPSFFPLFFCFTFISKFTSALCVEQRVGIVGNGYTLGPQPYPSSLRPSIRLAGPGKHGQTGLARSNTGSDTCVQYALPDQGPEGAGSRSRMAHHLGRAKLTLVSPHYISGKTPFGDGALPVGRHTGATDWAVLSRRLRRFCSVLPGDSIYKINRSSMQERLCL